MNRSQLCATGMEIQKRHVASDVLIHISWVNRYQLNIRQHTNVLIKEKALKMLSVKFRLFCTALVAFNERPNNFELSELLYNAIHEIRDLWIDDCWCKYMQHIVIKA